MGNQRWTAWLHSNVEQHVLVNPVERPQAAVAAAVAGSGWQQTMLGLRNLGTLI